MSLTEIQKDIIKCIIEIDENPVNSLTPCIEVLQQIFQNEYSNQEIEGNVLKLISKGVLVLCSFQSYLRLTEVFKSNSDYKLFKNAINQVYSRKL